MKLVWLLLVHITLHGMIGGRLRKNPHLLKTKQHECLKRKQFFIVCLLYFFNHHLSASRTNTSSLS